MYNENILKKENKYIINLSGNVEIEKILDVDLILNFDYSTTFLKLNNMIINKKENFYFIEKSDCFDKLKLIKTVKKIMDHNLLFLKYRGVLTKLQSDKKIITSDEKMVLKYVYYELFILLEIASIKHNKGINYDLEKDLIQKIIGYKYIFSEKRKVKQKKEYVRSKISERGSNVKYWNKLNYSTDLPENIIHLAKKIAMNELELPLKYDENNVVKLLSALDLILNKLEIKNRNFTLRFKKLKHYKKVGLYIKNAKCIIVDPRYTSSLFHELGHFLYETKTVFQYKNEKITQKKKEKIIEKHKEKYKNNLIIHKIEELNENSEVFAYWFEDEISKLI